MHYDFENSRLLNSIGQDYVCISVRRHYECSMCPPPEARIASTIKLIPRVSQRVVWCHCLDGCRDSVFFSVLRSWTTADAGVHGTSSFFFCRKRTRGVVISYDRGGMQRLKSMPLQTPWRPIHRWWIRGVYRGWG